MTWRFAFRRYRLAFRQPVRTGHGPWPAREGVLVRLEDEAGAVGYGEAATIPWFGTETADEVAAQCLSFGAVLTDAQAAAVPGGMACLRRALAAAAGPAPASAGKANLPVAALLPAGPASLGAAPVRADAGFRTFKWKVGAGDIDEELGVFDDLCGLLPQGSRIRLDANGAWDRRRAERWLERCAERPVEYVEQPSFGGSGSGEEDLLWGLAADYPTPIALDESLVGDADVERWLGDGWPGVYVVKPSLFADAPAVLARLAGAKAAVVFSSAFETAVGARHALELAFSWTGEGRAIGFGVWPLFEDARFDGPAAAPFIRWTDVQSINPEAAWSALS